MANNLSRPHIACRQMPFTATQHKYASAADDFNVDKCTLAGAKGIADMANRALAVFEQLMDARDAQVAAGCTIGELDNLLDVLEESSSNVFPAAGIFDDDAKLARKDDAFLANGRA